MTAIPTTIPQILDVPAGLDPALSEYLNSIGERLRVEDGTFGDPLDVKPTYRQLIESGVIEFRDGAGTYFYDPNGNSGAFQGTVVRILDKPPAVENFAITGGFNTIFVTWDPIDQASFPYYAYTEVWRETRTPVDTPADPDFATNAELIGRVIAPIYPDNIENPTEKSYYYWARHVSTFDQYGDFTTGNNGSPFTDFGTSSYDPEYIKTVLLLQLSESPLVVELTDRIDLIDSGGASGSGIVQDLLDEIANRISADSLEATARLLVASNLSTETTNRIAAISSESSARISGDSAEATARDIVAVDLSTETTNRIAAVTAEATARAIVEGDVTSLLAEYVVKLDVNGKVAGFGITNDGGTSEFVIAADKFALYDSGAVGNETAFPFVVGPVNGVQRISMNAQTYIQDLTVTNAAINTLSADKLFVASGTIADAIIGSANITNAMITNIIQAATWNESTKTGWKLDKNGQFQGSAVILYDSSGNVIFNSGGLGGAQGTKLSGIATGAQVNSPTIGCRINAIAFTGTNAGEIYVHGYNDLGVATDTDGVVHYAGNSYTVPKGFSGFYGHHDGWLVIDISGAASFPNAVSGSKQDRSVCYKDGSQWKFDNNSVTPQNFTPTSNMVIYGAVSFVGPENVLSANVWSEAQSLGQVSGFGSIDQISAANASTYIADLAVDTLQIADNAITIEGYNRYPAGTGTGNFPTTNVTMADCPGGVRTVFYVNTFVSDDGSNPSAYDIVIKIYEAGVLKDTYTHYLYSYGTDLVSVARVCSVAAGAVADIKCEAFCYDHATSTYTSATFVTITGTYAKK